MFGFQPEVNREIGACTVKHQNGQTTVNCPSVDFVVSSANVRMQVRDRSKESKLPLDDDTRTFTETDGTSITVDRTHKGDIAVVTVKSPGYKYGYSADVLPKIPVWPWTSESTFTKELLHDHDYYYDLKN